MNRKDVSAMLALIEAVIADDKPSMVSLVAVNAGLCQLGEHYAEVETRPDDMQLAEARDVIELASSWAERQQAIIGEELKACFQAPRAATRAPARES